MRKKNRLEFPKEKIEVLCRKHHIRKLSLFDSALRDDFGIESDVDVLVEFEPEQTAGLLRLAGVEIELSEILKKKDRFEDVSGIESLLQAGGTGFCRDSICAGMI